MCVHPLPMQEVDMLDIGDDGNYGYSNLFIGL